MDEEGNIVTDVSTPAYRPIGLLYCKVDGDVINWDIQPSLPSGLDFSTLMRSIGGQSNMVFPKTTFTITASSYEGSVNTTFSFEALPCSFGEYLLAKSSSLSHFSLRVTQDTGTIEEKDVEGSEFGLGLCIRRIQSDIELQCLSGLEGCHVLITTLDKFIYLYMEADENHNTTKTTDFSVTVAPSISLIQSELFVSKGDMVNIPVVISGTYTIPVIQPSDMSFDLIQHKIYGSISNPGVYTYSITTENPIGSSSASFTIYVNRCKEGLIVMQLRRLTSDEQDHIRLETSSGQLLLDSDISSRFQQLFCLQPGNYYVTMSTTRKSGSWNDNAELTVHDQDENMLTWYTLNDGSGSKQEMIHLFEHIPYQSLLRFSHVAPESNWFTSKYKDRSWQESRKGNWGSWSAKLTTVYFRKSFSISVSTQYTEMIIELLKQEGVIVYVNGLEIMRRNMPAGIVMDSTFASDYYPTTEKSRMTFSPALLNDGLNVLAIELHRAETTPLPSSITFDVFLTMTVAGCIPRSFPGEAISNEIHPSEEHPPSCAFDTNKYSYWHAENLPVSLTYTFTNHSLAYINQIQIMATVESDHNQPSDFDIVGITDNQPDEVLATVNSKTLFATYYDVITIPLDTQRSYNAFRFDFRGVNNGTSLDLNNIDFFACMRRSCKKFGIGTIPVNSYVSKRCPFLKTGVRRVQCTRHFSDVILVYNDSACLRSYPSKTESYIDFSCHIRECSLYQWYEYVSSAFIAAAVKYLTVKENEIVFYNVENTSDGKVFSVDVDVRFVMEAEIGDFVMKHLDSLLLNFTSFVQKEMKHGTIEDISITKGPKFHGQVNMYLIVIVVLVLIIVIQLLVQLYTWRISTKKSVKQLKSKTVKKARDENESLLENQV